MLGEEGQGFTFHGPYFYKPVEGFGLNFGINVLNFAPSELAPGVSSKTLTAPAMCQKLLLSDKYFIHHNRSRQLNSHNDVVCSKPCLCCVTANSVGNGNIRSSFDSV